MPVRMIKLEPDIDTRYYGDDDNYPMRPHVKMEEDDDDHYRNYESCLLYTSPSPRDS